MIRLFFLSVLAISLHACMAQSKAKPLNTTEFISLEKNDSVLVIDVRTPAEVAEAYIAGTDYFFDINNADFAKNIESLDKTKSYIVYCRSGKRSTSAINYMSAQGFTNLYELSGGILAWEDQSLLLSK
ncbi:MAG: rhodanese-like domain-containing protein [Chitinophagales bacterium]|nr:rhodanese-like domain-containing protein [Chitinophagales bacterium]